MDRVESLIVIGTFNGLSGIISCCYWNFQWIEWNHKLLLLEFSIDRVESLVVIGVIFHVSLWGRRKFPAFA